MSRERLPGKDELPRAKEQTEDLQSLAGLNAQEFEKLLVSFDKAWGAYVEETFRQKARQRSYGAGRKAELEEL